MKLLELLVKERIEWHPEALCYTQDGNLETYGYSDTSLELDEEWEEWSVEKMIDCTGGTLDELADDWETAIVTKEQYDNACKLVDDGYTLWFGGECPVNAHEVVEVVFDVSREGETHQTEASYVNWQKEAASIIAYKVINSKPDGSREPIGFNCRCVDEELSIVYDPADLLSLHVPDVVNHPSHYTNGKVECIDAIESATVGKTGVEAVCVANVIKYLWRYEDKNGLEDIKKAEWYLNKLIEVKK
ncbi:hypothetical protein Mulvp2_42 [Enterobacter phage Mulvp2]|nr:hypothetical protein Mulvp2_42 [Enterobacter phage Mulvp2]